MPGGKQASGDRVDRHLIRQHHPSAGDVRDIRGTGLSAYAARDQGTSRGGYEKGNQEYASHGISPLVLVLSFRIFLCGRPYSSSDTFSKNCHTTFLIIRFASTQGNGNPRLSLADPGARRVSAA